MPSSITMHWWKSTSSSPSSSSPSSPSRRHLRRLGAAGLLSPSGSGPGSPQPRLTRQRKLRHLTDEQVEGLARRERREEPLPAPADGGEPRSGSGVGLELDPVPLPLPLPELDLGIGARRSSGAGGEGLTKEKTNGTNKSRFASHFIGRGSEQVGTLSPKSNGHSGGKVFPSYSTVEEVHNFKLNLPTRSAPGSRLPSPVQSPTRRLSTSDFIPSSYNISQGAPFWFTPENHYSDTTTSGFSSLTSPEKFGGTSPDWSPLHSPTSKTLVARFVTSSGQTTPSHPKVNSDSPSWHDGLVNVHPLPLPPPATTPSRAGSGNHDPVVSENTSLKSQWKKGKLIGSGSFGNVYVAINKETGASCAMKEVNLIPDDPKSAECIKQLEQEIKVLSQLEHPNIVRYYGSESVGDRFYIFLEYVHPGSISKYIRDHCGAMTEAVVRNFTRHILSGLAYLHSANIIHRDIKGANLLVDVSGAVKLADFGMAKHLAGQDNVLSLRGTPFWMAPEVIQAMMKKGGYDQAVDIWSLGCTIIEMFTGKPPWIDIGVAPAMFKILHNESPPLPEYLSAEGKNFLQCCFRTNPAERPPASKLLEHPFVRNSCPTHDIPDVIEGMLQMKLKDTTNMNREWCSLVQTSRSKPNGPLFASTP